MGQHAKTKRIIDMAVEVLRDSHPMTVRQVYYQLVSRQVIENCRGSYCTVSRVLVKARQDGVIPWSYIEDRLRRPRRVSQWMNVTEFLEQVRNSYRRDVWSNQPNYVEAWCEKDALSGIFEAELESYGVTLNVGRGYDGWSSIRNAAERFRASGVDAGEVIYFGDFDPSGEDMVRSLQERICSFGVNVAVTKVALTAADVRDYSLPPDPAKRTDTRAARFIAEHGDVSVELDALPVDVLRKRIRREVEARMDLAALAETRRIERQERDVVAAMVS